MCCSVCDEKLMAYGSEGRKSPKMALYDNNNKLAGVTTHSKCDNRITSRRALAVWGEEKRKRSVP